MKFISLPYLPILLFIMSWNISSAQSFSYVLMPGDTALINQVDYCGDSIQWQVNIDNGWESLPNQNDQILNLTNTQGEDGIHLYRSVIYFINDTLPKYSTETSIRFATAFEQLEIADFYQGAQLYYVSPDTLRVAKVTGYTSVWGCMGETLAGADSLGFDYGQQNTNDILAACPSTNTAAYLCDTLTLLGHEDWYLPSIDEFNAMAQSPWYNADGSSLNDYFWSSTEGPSPLFSDNKAYYKLFTNNTNYTYFHQDKDEVLNIMAARMILNQTSSSFSISSYLADESFEGYITATPVEDDLTKVTIEYTGVQIDDAVYDWNFRYGEIISGGTGPGPHVVAYEFGGFRKVQLQLSNADCYSYKYVSNLFQVQVVEDIGAPFPEIYNGDVDLVDVNNDGLLDAFLTGSDTTVLYQNMGLDSFALLSTPFPDLSTSSAAWGDYNNDQFIDLLLSGINKADSLPTIHLFENIDGLQFTEVSTNLPSVYSGFTEWLDYDNDGMMDVLLSGTDSNNLPTTMLLRGSKTGIFDTIATPFPQLINSAVAIDDFNKDNFPDLLLQGKNDTVRHTALYRNNKGVFENTGLEITGLDNGDAVWADFNDDGLLDFYISGSTKDLALTYSPSGNVSTVSTGTLLPGLFLQNEVDVFEDIIAWPSPLYGTSSFLKCTYCDLETGDFDNDGREDFLLMGVPQVSWAIIGTGGGGAGSTSWNKRSWIRLVRNYPDAFANIELDIPGTWSINSGSNVPDSSYTSDKNRHTIMASFETSATVMADYNNDGNIDIFREGSGEGYRSAIYKHEPCIPNAAPAIPNGLMATIINCDSVRLSWNESTDDHTLPTSMTYEIYVGTSPGSGDIISKKNVRKFRTLFFELYDLPDSIYYWSVKAVDNAKVSSSYALEQSFEIDCIPNIVDSNKDLNQSEILVNVFPNPFEHSFTISTNNILTSETLVSFKLFNQLGQQVQSGAFRGATDVSMKAANAGLYYLELKAEDYFAVEKIFKH